MELTRHLKICNAKYKILPEVLGQDWSCLRPGFEIVTQLLFFHLPKMSLVCFICILYSSNSSSFMFWTSRSPSSSRCIQSSTSTDYSNGMAVKMINIHLISVQHTPLRIPRISGLKSQILKPPVLSEKWSSYCILLN